MEALRIEQERMLEERRQQEEVLAMGENMSISDISCSPTAEEMDMFPLEDVDTILAMATTNEPGYGHLARSISHEKVSSQTERHTARSISEDSGTSSSVTRAGPVSPPSPSFMGTGGIPMEAPPETSRAPPLHKIFVDPAVLGERKCTALARASQDVPAPVGTRAASQMKEAAAAAPPPKEAAAPPPGPSAKPPARPTIPHGKEEVTVPCPEIGAGWTQQLVIRKRGNRPYRYYFSPEGKKFLTWKSVNHYLGEVLSSTAQSTQSGSVVQAVELIHEGEEESNKLLDTSITPTGPTKKDKCASPPVPPLPPLPQPKVSKRLSSQVGDESDSNNSTSSTRKRYTSSYATPPKAKVNKSSNLVSPRSPATPKAPLDQEQKKYGLQLPPLPKQPPPLLSEMNTNNKLESKSGARVNDNIKEQSSTSTRTTQPDSPRTRSNSWLVDHFSDATPSSPAQVDHFSPPMPKDATPSSPATTTAEKLQEISLEPTTATTEQDIQLEAPMTPPPDVPVEVFMEMFFPTPSSSK